MTKFKYFAAGAALALALGAGAANATTIDFSTYAFGTPITTVGDATFSLQGGPGSGTPVTGSFNTASLGNSPTGEYPTAAVLDVSFATPVENISFTFNNFGDNTFFGDSTVTAYDAHGNVLGATNVASGAFASSFAPGSVAGVGVTDLQFSNGSGGGHNWEFGVGELTFTAVPEPATWAMMLMGVGMVGAGLRVSRRKSALAASAA